MKLELVMADPAGNRTALVRTPAPPSLWGETAKKIMAKQELRAEQVGYCCPPWRPSALGRLEMMGGEFCGNAARSFALLLATEKGLGRSIVPIEVSGCSGILPVEADPEHETAACPLPLPLAIQELEVPDLGILPAVRMEGITHVIIHGKKADEDLFRAVCQSASNRWEWEALGGMFLDHDYHTLTPVVAVRGTGSTVFESSCASGSAAVAAWLSQRDGDGKRAYQLAQPGGSLTVRVLREGGRLKETVVSGRVRLEKAVWIDL